MLPGYLDFWIGRMTTSKMEDAAKLFFDLENQDDVDLLHGLMADLSDIEDEDDENISDTEIVIPQSTSNTQRLRVGGDEVGKNQTERDEPTFDCNQPSTSSEQTSDELPVDDEVASTSSQQASSSSSGTETAINDILTTYFSQVEAMKKTVVARGNKKKVFAVQWNKQIIENSNDCPRISHRESQDAYEEENLSPLDLFFRYIPHSFFESTSYFTNLYAVRQGTKRFAPSTADEIKKLVGLHIIMGNLKYPRVHLYWDSSIRMKVFPDTMTRERFFQLRTNLHVNDNEAPNPKRDRFIKVRPLYDSIRERCLQMPLEEQLSIDEQMVPFRGKFDQLQYVKGKPCPWGMKIFCLCGKSGYPYDFILYQGPTTEFDGKEELGMSASVVYTLANRRVNDGKYHELYYDNYFSSYHLLRILKRMNINAAGTIRVNRFFHPTITPEKKFLKSTRGSSEEVTCSTGDVTVVQWVDNKSVLLASNFVGIGVEDDVKRWDKSFKQYVQIKRPEVIRKYNHAMGGVDLLDQMIGLYRIFIRSRKWTLRMIFHAFELAMICAWKEYKKMANEADIPTNQQYDLLNFRMRLADQLICSSLEKKSKRGRPSAEIPFIPSKKNKPGSEKRPIEEIVFDSKDHLAHHDDKSLPTRCKKIGCPNKTHILCLKCEVHLCINNKRNCFSEFHSK